MKKTVALVLVAVAVAALIFLAVTRPELLEKTWLWLIGFAGLIYGAFQRIARFFTSDRRLDEIETSNEGLKQDLARLQDERATADARLARDRAEHRAALVQLQARLAEEQARAKAAEEELARVREMSYREYFESLTEDEQRRATEEMWRRVDFGL